MPPNWHYMFPILHLFPTLSPLSPPLCRATPAADPRRSIASAILWLPRELRPLPHTQAPPMLPLFSPPRLCTVATTVRPSATTATTVPRRPSLHHLWVGLIHMIPFWSVPTTIAPPPAGDVTMPEPPPISQSFSVKKKLRYHLTSCAIHNSFLSRPTKPYSYDHTHAQSTSSSDPLPPSLFLKRWNYHPLPWPPPPAMIPMTLSRLRCLSLHLLQPLTLPHLGGSGGTGPREREHP